MSGYLTSASQLSNALIVKSPYPYTIHLFNNEESSPNVSVAIAGIEKTLKLHRSVLESASITFKSLFNGEKSSYGTYDDENKRMELIVKADDNADVFRSVLMKWLRFCYGEEQVFSCEECTAALVALKQLQLTCGDETETIIFEHMNEVAKQNVDVGAMMLRSCSLKYKDDTVGMVG